MKRTSKLEQYYQKRAKEYDRVYLKTERQADLKHIKAFLSASFPTKNIIEIACGTGYWTTYLAQSAASIYGIDINEEVLTLAKARSYACANVIFDRRDYRDLIGAQSYEGLFGGFIWSHIRKEALGEFLQSMMSLLKPDSEVIFIDNRYVLGSSTPISKTDQQQNTYQIRQLHNGASFEIIKNFPDQEEIIRNISEYARGIEWIPLEYFWILKFRKK